MIAALLLKLRSSWTWLLLGAATILGALAALGIARRRGEDAGKRAEIERQTEAHGQALGATVLDQHALQAERTARDQELERVQRRILEARDQALQDPAPTGQAVQDLEAKILELERDLAAQRGRG